MDRRDSQNNDIDLVENKTSFTYLSLLQNENDGNDNTSDPLDLKLRFTASGFSKSGFAFANPTLPPK